MTSIDAKCSWRDTDAPEMVIPDETCARVIIVYREHQCRAHHDYDWKFDRRCLRPGHSPHDRLVRTIVQDGREVVEITDTRQTTYHDPDPRGVLDAMRAFVWHEKMHLPARVYRRLQGTKITVTDAEPEVTPARGGYTVRMGSFAGRPGAGSIVLYAGPIERDAPPGQWHSALRRAFRHEVLHAIGANHATIHSVGDVNDLPLDTRA